MMAILSKACKPDNFELLNSLKLCFTKIWDLCSHFVDCKPFLESNSPDILICVRQTWMTQSIQAISLWEVMKMNFHLIWKDSTTHMHGLIVFVKEGLSFAWDFSLENSADSYLYFWLALLHSVSYFFFLYRSSLFLCTIFDSFI